MPQTSNNVANTTAPALPPLPPPAPVIITPRDLASVTPKPREDGAATSAQQPPATPKPVQAEPSAANIDLLREGPGLSVLPPPLNLTPDAGTVISTTSQSRDVGNREDVIWLQERLFELEYLRRRPTGTWDQQSRRAVTDFKTVNRLPRTDQVDTETAAALASKASIPFNDSFLGAWSETFPCPGARQADIVISANRATSSAGGICEFLNISPDDAGWQLRAKCTDQGSSWTYDLRFSSGQGRLVWKGKSVTNY